MLAHKDNFVTVLVDFQRGLYQLYRLYHLYRLSQLLRAFVNMNHPRFLGKS